MKKTHDRNVMVAALPEVLILILVVVAILLGTSKGEPADNSDLDFADRRQAKIFADSFCRALKCSLPLAVEVVDEDHMPRNAIATTTVVVADAASRCLLTFTRKSAWKEEVVAHEACHCALDYQIIGPYGYEGLGRKEVKQREGLVGACADRLMEAR